MSKKALLKMNAFLLLSLSLLAAAGGDPWTQALLQEKITEYRRVFSNPYLAATHLHVDDIIHPADTRLLLISALKAHMGKMESRPAKKHGVMPA